MVIVESLETRKLPYETDGQFLNRLCSVKETLKLTWKKIAEIANEELNLSYSESWYRRNYQAGAFDETEYVTTSASSDYCTGDCNGCLNFDDCLSEYNSAVQSELIDKEQQIEDKLTKLKLKQAEVADMVTSNNAMIRRMSREQTIKDIAHDFAVTMSNNSHTLLSAPQSVDCLTDIEGVLLISDWHYGMLCDNHWNKFSPTICKQRVSNLLDKTVASIKANKLKKLTVLDLSDLIAGRIHTQIRIESRFDVITQTMEVSEILAEFLTALSVYCPVDFYSCLDNHSRLEPNKKESMDLESLTRIIPWYLKERLENNERIHICENEFGEDIITCEVLGHDIVAVHGHDDSPSNALEKLSMLTRKHYDLVCMAHRHHLFLEEQFEGIVVSNGCLVGVDSHAKKMRLTSKPSQTLILVTEDNVIEDVKRILV